MTAAPQEGPWSATELAQAVHRGDETAFTELHHRYAGRLLRYSLVMARGDEATAHETVQTTFLRAIRSLHSVADEAALWAWLAKAARCAAADAARGEKRRFAVLQRLWQQARSEPPPLDYDPEARWESALQTCLTALPTHDRALLHAKYHDRQSLATIAQHHRTTDRAIESRLARLRAALRTAILQELRHRP